MQLNSILLTQDERYKRLHSSDKKEVYIPSKKRKKKGVYMIGMYKV